MHRFKVYICVWIKLLENSLRVILFCFLTIEIRALQRKYAYFLKGSKILNTSCALELVNLANKILFDIVSNFSKYLSKKNWD